MTLKFYIYHSKKWLDVTSKIIDVEWSESMDALGIDFSFKYPYSRDDPDYRLRFSLGDIFKIKYGKIEIVRGVITQKSLTAGEYSGHDFAFYLNKSEVLTQFKKLSASKAIRRLCEMYEVPVGKIPNMATPIKKVYKDVTVADAIKDILKKVRHETGHRYRIEMEKGKVVIRQANYYKIDPHFTVGKSKIRCSSTAVSSGDLSIEEMKNKIIVAGTDEKKKQVKATIHSASSIKKYGVLTEVVTKDKLKAAQARNIAKNTLANHNRIARNVTLEMVGNPFIKPGRKIYINKPETYLKKGYYAIKSTTHSYNQGIYKVSIELR